MINLKISEQTAELLRELTSKTQRTIDEVLMLLIEQYEQSVMTIESAGAEQTWTDEELAQLFSPQPPLTGKGIVEKHLASGVIGSLADMEIDDGTRWVNEQKDNRRKKRKW